MKKRLTILLGSLVLAISLTACGSDPTTKDYNGKSYSDILTETDQYINVISSLYSMYEGTEDFDYSILTTDDAIEYFDQYGVNETELAGVSTWAEIVDTYGSYAGYDSSDFSISVAGKTTTADVTLMFGDDESDLQDVTFELVYTTWNMEVSSVSINVVQTLGQKMANAGLNTLISMAIVFIVLILISLVIYAFNIFPYLEKKKKEKANEKTKEVATDASADVAVAAATEEAFDDYELVAVIAAAIAASEGCSTSDFVVRSINRR